MTESSATNSEGWLDLEALRWTHWLAIGLVVMTAIIHIGVGAVESRPPLVLAGLGYVGGVGLFLIGYRRRLLYLLAIGYTAIQVGIWAVVQAGTYTPVGLVDKAIQIALIAVLAWLYRGRR